MKDVRSADKFRGCLLGGAIGDALGYPIEFLSYKTICEVYGGPICDYADLRDGEAQFSDDTQMTLYTAYGLLTATTQGYLGHPMPAYLDHIRTAYLDWYDGQNGAKTKTWLGSHKGLVACRAPGNTCLSALGSRAYGTTDAPINHSKGCGGVMRVAPIGLYFAARQAPQSIVDKLGADAAALTHGHELGYLSAAILVHLVSDLAVRALPIEVAVQNAMTAVRALYPDAKHFDGQQALIDRAIALSGTDGNDAELIHTLGGGWVGEEALAIAIFCALRYRNDFNGALIASVNHDGDSDSTGAITGNIMGAMLGAGAIEARWIERLEHVALIEELALDLYLDCEGSFDGADKQARWLKKYA